MNTTKPERWILLGIPVLFLVGGLMHFAYDLSGQNPLVGLIAPVNESVFEHMKLLLPMIPWWCLYERFQRGKQQIDRGQWQQATVVALVVAIIVIPMVFYTYRYAFGIESLVVDILILLIALSVGQILGLHVYRYGRGVRLWICLLTVIGVVLLFVILTLYPPKLPLFMDSNTGTYGMMKK